MESEENALEKLRKGDIVIIDNKSIGEITRLYPKEDFLNLQLADVNILGKGRCACDIESLRYVNLQKLCELAISLEDDLK